MTYIDIIRILLYVLLLPFTLGNLAQFYHSIVKSRALKTALSHLPPERTVTLLLNVKK